MGIEDDINNYINVQAEPKRNDMHALHRRIVQLFPDCQLWV